MELYVSIYFVMMLMSLLSNRQWLSYVLSCLFLVCLAGFRDISVGIDTHSYAEIFGYLKNGYGYYYGVEPGWNYINLFVIKFGGIFLNLLLLTALITVGSVYYVAKKNCPYMFFAVFIYYSLHIYCGSFNIMRQYLGVSIVLIAYHLLAHEKRTYALVVWLMACSIHFSCLVAGIVFFIHKVKFSISIVVAGTVASLLLGAIINDSVIDVITFSEYTNVADVRNDTLTAAILTILVDVILITIVVTSKVDIAGSFWGRLYVLSIFIFNITFNLKYSMRLYSLFAIAQVIYYPIYLKNSKFSSKAIPSALILFYVSLQFWRMILANGNGIIPYNLNNGNLPDFILYLFYT